MTVSNKTDDVAVVGGRCAGAPIAMLLARAGLSVRLLERSARLGDVVSGHLIKPAALDRNELGALLVAAGLGSPAEHALISLLALNGLRVSEATGADIEHLGLERGHRTLTITRKGGKVVTIPLAPRTARAIDLAIGERTGGPVFLAADGQRLDRHGAGRIVRKTARRAGIGKTVTPHTLRHALPRRWMLACHCATCKKPPRTPIRGPRCGMTGPAAA